jgi:small GTP-binding protein
VRAQYEPTVFDNYSASLMVDGTPLTLSLWDTAGQEDYDRLRPLSYAQTDCFLLCFSLINQASLNNLTSKWLPELRVNAPYAKIVLVGTKSDLAHDGARARVEDALNSRGRQMASETEAEELAARLGTTYVRCSALTQMNLKLVFDTAVRKVLAPPEPPRKAAGSLGALVGRLAFWKRTRAKAPAARRAPQHAMRRR